MYYYFFSFLSVSDKIKNAANICLLCLTLLAVYSHFMVADKLERTAPALVFLFLLCGRLVVFWQLSRKEMDQTQTHVNGFKQDHTAMHDHDGKVKHHSN